MFWFVYVTRFSCHSHTENHFSLYKVHITFRFSLANTCMGLTLGMAIDLYYSKVHLTVI